MKIDFGIGLGSSVGLLSGGDAQKFMELVKTVGAPVRDKLLADGVILAWGVHAGLLRAPGNSTHTIWYSVADWSGIEKVGGRRAAQRIVAV